jgi:rubrerythrin
MTAMEVTGTVTIQGRVRRAASSCCGAKLNAAGNTGDTQYWVCRECGLPCDRREGPAEDFTSTQEVNIRG